MSVKLLVALLMFAGAVLCYVWRDELHQAAYNVAPNEYSAPIGSGRGTTQPVAD